MLVTFHCKVSGNIIMFGDVAKQMLKMMGFCENIPGAIDAEDVPVALNNLQQALNRIRQIEIDAGNDPVIDIDDYDEQDVEPVVGVNTRALPLLEMLKEAKAAQCYIMWE
ncbi:DUF1840 domain-containing protein [uncultured Photobacterium sp.]|uniref:DUF1840 domain-containing protein n=1 Tax=uncultured Photobacterium sp. TaxID=173973 RepID=UPI00262DC6C2|nr:DUF1840 domain-containing protein [uncultured Photobacterium sp.]